MNRFFLSLLLLCSFALIAAQNTPQAGFRTVRDTAAVTKKTDGALLPEQNKGFSGFFLGLAGFVVLWILAGMLRQGLPWRRVAGKSESPSNFSP